MSVKTALLAGGVPHAIADHEAPAATAAMLEFGIDSQQRASMFIAQVLEESVDLRYFEEIATGEEYEGRHDLGNVYPGDGPRYKGRGPIQLTGRANYRWAGRILGLDLEGHPELAARHDIGWRIAGLYWKSHGLNELADRGEFVAITKRINGGLNGYSVRYANLQRVKRVDCRPRRPDPFAGYPKHERDMLVEYDRLKARGQDRARRAELRADMLAARKVIWVKAQPRPRGDGHGWHYRHRIDRYRSLKART